MKYQVVINKNKIRQCLDTFNSKIPVTDIFHAYHKTASCWSVDFEKENEIIGTLIYSPNKPLSCGARLWLETELEVRPLLINGDIDPDTARQSLAKDIANKPKKIHINQHKIAANLNRDQDFEPCITCKQGSKHNLYSYQLALIDKEETVLIIRFDPQRSGPNESCIWFESKYAPTPLYN